MKSWSDYVGQEVAGRWRLLSLVGVGSFGAVYAAEANRTGNPIAIRLLDPRIGGASTFDASVFTGFRHAHAVEISDVGPFEETQYLVMRRAAGTPLKVREPWAGDQVLEFVRQIGTALIEFQKKFDLQHLHLHPGNVFVEVSPGQKPRFQLADLGLASQVGAGDLILEAIRERHTTPECLSPEQLQGHVPSSQSDVYAFGAMLFQLLSGTPPFPYTGESLSAYALHVDKSLPPRFSDVSDELEVDAYLESLVLRCLSKKPASRPQSIRELVDSYEAAYREFQMRSLSGMVSPFHDADTQHTQSPSRNSIEQFTSSPVDASVAPSASARPVNSSANARMEPPAPVAGDRHSAAPLNDLRSEADKTSPTFRREDSTYELPPAPAKPSERTSEILRKSEAILEDVDSHLDLWAGLQRPEDSSDVRPTDEELSEEDSFYAPDPAPNAPPKPTPTPYRSPPTCESWPEATSGSSPKPSRVEQTLNPASAPVAATRHESMDQTPMPGFLSSDGTVALQQQYLQQLGMPSSPRSTEPTPFRQRPKRSGPPKIVTGLFVAVVVLAAGLLIYGQVLSGRLRSEISQLAEESRYEDAKTKLQSSHILTRLWLDQETEWEAVLAAGLERARDWQKSNKLSEAVRETERLEATFGRIDAAQEIRKEIAEILRQRVLDKAKQLNPIAALDEMDASLSELAKAFQSRATPEFDTDRVKGDVFAKGLEIARKKSSEGNLEEAVRVLEKWDRAFQDESAISENEKQELQDFLCETRMRKGFAEATRETDATPARFAGAIGILTTLENELDAGRCSSRKPEVLRRRGEIFHSWAESQTGSDTDIADRFSRAIADFSTVLKSLEQRSSGDFKALHDVTLAARANSYWTRGRWLESRAKNQPVALLPVIQDFKASLEDIPQRPELRQRLSALREQTMRDGLEALGSAQLEDNSAAADDKYCEAEQWLTVAIAACVSREDDPILRLARLRRGLARSSRRIPDFAHAVEDLASAVVDATELHLTEIGKQTMSEVDSEDRQRQLRYLFAVGRSELAWLLATWPDDRERNAARGTIDVVEQSAKAVEVLAELSRSIDNGNLKANNAMLRDQIFHDGCMARRARIAALADRDQFARAKIELGALQGDIGSQNNQSETAKALLSKLVRDLEEMRAQAIEKNRPYRTSYPIESAKKCESRP